MHPLAALPDAYKTAAAGGGAGLVAAMVVCPLDVVKIRLQTSARLGGGARLGGPLQALRTIWADEGPRGLYRGLAPTICAYLPNWCTYFIMYEGLKRTAARWGWTHDLAVHVGSAALAGLTSTALTAPFWVIRTRIMAQPARPTPSFPYYYRGFTDAVRTMYASEGLASFYRGLVPSLLGVMHVVVQFPLYERLKQRGQPPQARPDASTVLCASAASKFVASLATFPHEVIRTRLQTQTSAIALPGASLDTRDPHYRGVIDAVRRIAREEGVRGFYSGFGTNLVRTVPASAVTLWAYELLRVEFSLQPL